MQHGVVRVASRVWETNRQRLKVESLFSTMGFILVLLLVINFDLFFYFFPPNAK